MRLWLRYIFSASLVALCAGFTFHFLLNGAPLRLDLSSSSSNSLKDMWPQVNAIFQTKPAVEQMVASIQKAQGVQVVIAQSSNTVANPVQAAQISQAVTTATGVPCENCQQPTVSNLKFEQCTNKNNYFEKQLDSAKSNKGLMSYLMDKSMPQQRIISEECVKAGMELRFGSKSKNFSQCAGGSRSQSARDAYRPCISEDYFNLINNSFNLASRCLAPLLSKDTADQRQDIRAVFSMLTVESGLHVNARSYSGAGGMGQLTSDAISDVNDKWMGKVRETLNAQGGACATLNEEVLSGNPPMQSNRSLSCQRMTIDKKNPLLNLVYTYAYIALSKKGLSKSVFDDQNFKTKFALPSAEMNRLKTTLSIWAHNTGPAGMTKPLLGVINRYFRGQNQVTDANRFLQLLAKEMKEHPHSANSSSDRREETSTYWPKIQNSMLALEKNVGGGTCFAL